MPRYNLSDEDRKLLARFREVTRDKSGGMIAKETDGAISKSTAERLKAADPARLASTTRIAIRAYLDQMRQSPGRMHRDVPRETNVEARPLLTVEQKAALFDAIAAIVMVGLSNSKDAAPLPTDQAERLRLAEERLRAIEEAAEQGYQERARTRGAGRIA